MTEPGGQVDVSTRPGGQVDTSMRPVATLSKADYAAKHGTSEKTAQRVLNAGLLNDAGAVLVDGVWSIPADAPSPQEARRGIAVTVARPAASRAAEVSVPATVAGGRFFWTVDELVDLFAPHVTRHALEQMLRTGELVGYKRGPGGSWIVPTGELRRLLGA